MTTPRVLTCIDLSRLNDQCIDNDIEHRILVRLSGLIEGETGRSRRSPAKVPYLLGFYPPTLWSPGDYTNMNFLGIGLNINVNLTHRDRLGSDRRNRPVCGHYRSNVRTLLGAHILNPLFPLVISRRLPGALPRITPVMGPVYPYTRAAAIYRYASEAPPPLPKKVRFSYSTGDSIKFFPNMSRFSQDAI